MTMKPLTVQLGLLYINEEDGPTRDLLCNVNVIPRIINMMPTTNNDLPMSFFRCINYIRTNAQKRYPSLLGLPNIFECNKHKEIIRFALGTASKIAVWFIRHPILPVSGFLGLALLEFINMLERRSRRYTGNRRTWASRRSIRCQDGF